MRRRDLMALVTGAVVLASCANPGASGGSAATVHKIGVDYALVDSPFMTLVDNNIKSGATERGLEALPALNAALDVTKQATDVKSLITQGVSALIVMPIDTSAIVSSLKDAEKADIPVVVFDTLPDEGPVYMSVRTNNIEMGDKACRHLAELTGGTGKVVEIQGDLASIAGRERSQGFEDCMAADFPNIEILKVAAVWDPAKAASGLETILTSTPDLAGIYLHSGGGYLAPTLQVLERKDRLFPAGDPKHLPLVSIDGEPAELDAIRDGFLDSTVSQPADLYGSLSMFYAAEAIKGTVFQAGATDHDSMIIEQPGGILEDSLPSTFVDKENVDDPTLWANASK